MGGLFSSKKEQKQESAKYHEASDSFQPNVHSTISKPTQSRGEVSYENSEIPSNDLKNQLLQSSIIHDHILEQQGYNKIDIDKTGNLIRSATKIDQLIKCFECGCIVNDTIIKVFCQHEFHQDCFVRFVEKQLIQEKFIIKCKCGTKINTNILRQIANENLSSKLLYSIFSTQLSFLLKHSNLRKNNDYQQIIELSQSNIDKEDQIIDLDSENKKLKQKIKEFTLDSSGILHMNQSQLFMISFCLFCTLEIDEVVIQVNCKHRYHEKCLIQWLENQIKNNKSQIIKCRCGSKLNTNVLRRIPDEKQRLTLLNYLFSNQLSKLLLQLKKKEEFDQIMELFYLHQFTIDQDYKSTTGFLYFSNYSTPGGD